MADEQETFFSVMFYPILAVPIVASLFVVANHFTKKMKKCVKLYICFDSERIMDDVLPYKAYWFLDDAGTKPEIRRFYLNKNAFGKIRPIKSKLREIYPKLKKKNFTVAWKDEDGDEVIMSTDEEVQTMFNEYHDTVLKLVVRISNSKDDDTPDDVTEVTSAAVIATTAKPAQTNISNCLHKGVICCICSNAVIGFRYKCITCDDFDLCARCENGGKHSEHCVVRVPLTNMSVPLIKASIKKSRRFLKSFASQAHEENKKLRRERGKHSAALSSSIQGKQDSQPRAYRNWVEIFGKYMEEFANLAGDFNRYKEKKLDLGSEARSTMPSTSATTPPKKVPINEEISLNPWDLPQEDLEKLQHACKYMRDNALGATTKALNKVLEIAATVAEEATAQTPARACPPISKATVNKSTDEIKQQTEEAPMTSQDAEEDTSEAEEEESEEESEPEQDETNTEQEPLVDEQETAQTSQGASKSGQHETDSAKNENMKVTIPGKQTPEAMMAKDTLVKRCGDLTEMVKSVVAANSDLSSNASSCSSEGHGSDKAEGWTVIEPSESVMKDLVASQNKRTTNIEDLPEDIQERIRYQAPIYPSLNTKTAVLDLNEPNGAIASASAPPMAKVDRVKAKIAQAQQAAEAAAAAAALRKQLAPHVEASVQQMEAMGFSNESGWLTQLLHHNDGNIATVLDLITPGLPPTK